MTRRRAAIILIVAGGALLAVTLIAAWLRETWSQAEPIALPAELAGIPLVDVLGGKEALYDFSSLHGQDFPLVAGAVGHYINEHRITLWVGVSPWEPLSPWMVGRMHDAIASGGSPFLPVGENVGIVRTIYELEGLGQRHYYFYEGRQIIWIAADAAVAEQALEETVAFFNK